LIIGKPTLKNYKLLQKVHDQFWGISQDTGIEEDLNCMHAGLEPHESLLATQILATLQERDELLSWEQDDPEFDKTEDYHLPLDIGNPIESLSNIPAAIHGTPELKESYKSS
jgi:hypothetical protein